MSYILLPYCPSVLVVVTKKTSRANKPTCSLKIDALDGTEWVYLDGSQKPEVPPPKLSDLNFIKNNNTMVKYNSLSLAEMYDYECKIDAAKNQIQCNSTPDPKEVCKAYLASDKKCTNNAMAKFYDKFDEKELKKAVSEAKKEQGQAYKQKKLEQFNKLFNRLDNKLMGRMNIDINAEDCNLQYMIYQPLTTVKLLKMEMPLVPMHLSLLQPFQTSPNSLGTVIPPISSTRNPLNFRHNLKRFVEMSTFRWYRDPLLVA